MKRSFGKVLLIAPLFFIQLSYGMDHCLSRPEPGHKIGLIQALLRMTDKSIDKSSQKYDEHFPYYVKFCSISKYKMKDGQSAIEGAVEGMPTGHFAFYLKGACMDPHADYPRLNICDENTDLTDPNNGVGVSANIAFDNVNFVAVKGMDFFLRGGLSPNEALNEKRFNQILEESLDRGVYENIKLKKKYVKIPFDPNNPTQKRTSLKDYTIYHGITSDFALNLGRTGYCVNIPVNRRVMKKVINHLNYINDFHANADNKDLPSGMRGRNYNWNALSNNCVHCGMRVASLLGLVHGKKIGPLLLPGNHIVDLANGTLNADFSVDRIYKNKTYRKLLEEENFLPIGIGAITDKIIPYNLKENTIFEYDEELMVLRRSIIKPFSLFNSEKGDLEMLFRLPKYRNLSSSLQNSISKMEIELKKMEDQEKSEVRGKEKYLKFRAKYKSFLLNEIHKGKKILKTL